MTDHHDDLASAYLDGQVSPEEAARVEGDPRLMAEVEALAAVVEQLQSDEVAVDAGTRRRHLSAALGAFDQLAVSNGSAAPDAAGPDAAGTDRPGGPTNVVPLDRSAGRAATGGVRARPQPDEIARRAARVASASGGDHRLRRRRQGVPSWLGAAAALLVIGGGVAWFMGGQNQSSDTEAATIVTDQGGGAAADNATALSQAAGAGAPLTSAVPAAGMESAELHDDRADDGTATDAAQAPAAGSGATEAPAPPLTTTAPATSSSRAVITSAATISSTVPSSTTAPPSVLAFATAPTGPEVQARLAATGGSPSPAGGSSCGQQVAAPAGAALVGYVPITVDGVAGEGLFYRGGSGAGGTTVLVVRTASCQAFS